jgi:chromosome segregation ATPase
LKSVKQSKDAVISVEVQEVMNSEMSAIIAQLKAQREETEKKLREAEIEATRLHIEKEVSKRHIIELETRQNETENRLEETKKEAKMVQATSVVEVANKESEKIMVAAELQQVQKEREEMSKMIKKLERAKGDMEGRLRDAQDEAQVLKVEKDVVTKRVTEVEQERETLTVKLSQIERTRGDIETRMKEAEEELNQLKAEKKFKTKEIRDMRASEHCRSIMFQAEDERKNITQNLKKISEEKEQMRAMMAQLDSSRHRLQDILDDTPEDINEEMSIDIVAQSMGMYGSQANQRDPYSVYPQTQSTPSQPARSAGVSPVSLSQSTKNYLQPSKAMGDMPMSDNRRNEMVMKDFHVGEERVALVNWLGDSIQLQQEQRLQPPRTGTGTGRRNSSAPLDDDEEEIPHGERPAGWLGHTISNRSFNNLNAAMEPRGAAQEASSRRRDPSTHVRQAGTQETAYESQNLRSKREKARSAERRLRQEMDRSNRSMEIDDGSSDGMDGLSIYSDEEKSQELRIAK